MSSLIISSGASIIASESRVWIACRLFRKRGSLNSTSVKKGSRRFLELIANAEKRRRAGKRTWWQNLFSDEEEDDGWFGSSGMDVFDDAEADELEEASEDDKFQAWKRRAEAISELREAQEGTRNSESREWEDWLDGTSGNQELGDSAESSSQKTDDAIEVMDAMSFFDAIRGIVSANDDNEELLFEDRVFQYAWTNSVKFLGLLVIIPCAFSFLVHNYVLMPFLDRYVKTVPLAAEMLDVRRHQKLDMIKTLKVEEARFRFEVEIGKSPPLFDEELWLELRHKAIELRDEKRLENRHAFANIWSDMVYGIVLFILIYANKSKVALLKFTGYKLLNNISDTGKAFLIILTTDIFLGYHSESGWQVLVEILLERYGLEVDQAAITIFICTIPVVIDACVKLWLFKFLPKLSPNVANIFQEMKRH